MALLEGGEVRELPLDAQGAMTASFAGEVDRVFGPFPIARAEGARVMSALVLTSESEVAWGAVEALDWTANLDTESLKALVSELGMRAVAMPVVAGD